LDKLREELEELDAFDLENDDGQAEQPGDNSTSINE
jgi:hypothetical protein